ncbi:hypothetical protein DQP55_23270 [Mycolicibacterium sp. GF69]|nr:hypothetical protein DQP55_23270 [Mycolicibacterium sp. GF69]
MGVTALVVRWAAHRPHVLLVEIPGQWTLRARVERELATRGWQVASSPAGADVLAVCGMPGTELSAAVERVWEQLPGPRVRTAIADGSVIGTALDDAAGTLIDIHRHRDDARKRRQSPEADDAADADHHAMGHGGMDHLPTDHGTMHGDHGHMDHGDMDHPYTDHRAMGHAHTDHGGMDHAHMDHGDMDMAPAGIALAQGAEDRDGLEMDVLNVRLGPVLPHWPAGLVLACTLHGDVIGEAKGWRVDAEHLPRSSEAVATAARQWDHIVDVLALAGWPHAAGQARRVRDALLTEAADGDRVMALLVRLHDTVRRSRVLRWSLRGLGMLSVEQLGSRDLPLEWAGDTYDRLLNRIRHARSGIGTPPPSADVIEALPGIVAGLDVAAARLVIASLGIDVALGGQAGQHG